MASEFDIALRNAASSVSRYVQDAATMQVETHFVDIGPEGTPDFDGARPVARTIIRLDGDSETVVPMREGESENLEVDLSLFNLHQQNVDTAIEYRARILNALLSPLIARTS